LLDVTTYKPNSIEYTGAATVDMTSAGPARQFHAMKHIAPDDMVSGRQPFGAQLSKSPVTPDAFGRGGTLSLARGDSFLECAVVDSAAGFAYFGTATNPGAIVKIRLSDFTRVGALTLPPGEDGVSAAVIDPAAGFAYFGTINAPTSIVRIRLS